MLEKVPTTHTDATPFTHEEPSGQIASPVRRVASPSDGVVYHPARATVAFPVPAKQYTDDAPHGKEVGVTDPGGQT